MGLVRTGLTLAGGYGLIRTASKAANEYQDHKQPATQYGPPQPHYYPQGQYYQGPYKQPPGNDMSGYPPHFYQQQNASPSSQNFAR